MCQPAGLRTSSALLACSYESVGLLNEKTYSEVLIERYLHEQPVEAGPLGAGYRLSFRLLTTACRGKNKRDILR